MRRMHDDKEVISNVKIDNDTLIVENAAGNVNEYEISLTTEALSEVLEGSETVVVDLNEDDDKLQVRLDQDIIDEIDSKLDASKSAISEVGGLVVPSAAPAEDKLVGIDTANGQELIGIGSGLTLANGVLSAGGSAGGLTMDLLWTNARPQDLFARQTMTINGISDYKFIKIVYCNNASQTSTGEAQIFNLVVDTIDMVDLNYNNSPYYRFTYIDSFSITSSGASMTNYNRRIYNVEMSNNRFTMDDCQMTIFSSSGSQSTSNKWLVPYKIYGIK